MAPSMGKIELGRLNPPGQNKSPNVGNIENLTVPLLFRGVTQGEVDI